MAYFICMHFISAWTSRFLCRLLYLNSYAFELLFDNVLYLFFLICIDINPKFYQISPSSFTALITLVSYC